MADGGYLILEDRGVIKVEGEDADSFLQGIVSNDVHKVTPARTGYGAFLTPQGKYLFDFFMIRTGDGAVLLDCERARLDDFRKRLRLYKLRSKVEVADVSESHAVAALFGDGALDALGLPAERGAARAFADGLVYTDPRLADIGARAVLPADGAQAALADTGLQATERAAYERLRLRLGLPDASRDITVEKSTLLECGFDELGGVDWHKGCYMGQELTARTKHRGLVKRRLVPVEIDGPVPEPGTPVTADGKQAGEMRSAVDGVGLALLKLDYMDDGTLAAGEAAVKPRKPHWAAF